MEMCEIGGCSSINDITMPDHPTVLSAMATLAPLNPTALTEDRIQLKRSESTDILVPSCTLLTSTSPLAANSAVDELNRIVGYHQSYLNQPSQFLPLQLQSQFVPLDAIPISLANISDKIWEWNPIPEARGD